jgi:hemolysin activation/secretion protein
MVRGVFVVLILWAALLVDAAAQSPVPGAGDLLGPRRGSGAAPELPRIEPAAPPQPGIAAPAPSAPTQPLSAAPIFVLRGVRIEGNSVLDDAAIGDIVAPHIDKPASIASLEELRRALTLLYIQRGYINSGVTIPDQNVEKGVVTLRAVEGRVTEIDVSGTDNFSPEFFRARLERGLTAPFKVSELERQQQILLQDPLVRRLNIELLPGLVPGQAKLHADVQERSPFSVTAQIANNQSPSVGEIRGQIQGSVANILGVGDILAAQYGRSQGINDGSIAYSLPIASDDTRVSLRYDINGTLVVTPALAPLNVTSRYDSSSVGLSRPMYRTAEQNFTLGANLERRRAQTFPELCSRHTYAIIGQETQRRPSPMTATDAPLPEEAVSANDTVADMPEVSALLSSLAEAISRTRPQDFATIQELRHGTLTVLWMGEDPTSQTAPSHLS